MTRREREDPAKAARSTMNMTPMIDVTFQLIVVFLCCMKFRTLDQKLEAFLPQGGPDPRLVPVLPETHLTVELHRRPGEGATEVRVLGTRLGMATDAATWRSLSRRIDAIHRRDEGMKGRIEASPEVPHGEVMAALDAFLGANLTKVVFRGTPINRTGLFGPREPR